MTDHPALAPGRVAVITGAASGIGLAAAVYCAGRGMAVALADLPGEALDAAARTVSAVGSGPVRAVPTDVSDRAAVEALRAEAAALGPVSFVMANAGIEAG